MVAVGLICIATAQEVLNFPIGPAHNADTWRTNARLGVGCFGAQAWSSKIPYPGRYVILLTRCTDTSAQLTSLSLSRVIEEFERQGLLYDIDVICFWSGGAPHYLSRCSWAWYDTSCIRKFGEQVLARVWGCRTTSRATSIASSVRSCIGAMSQHGRWWSIQSPSHWPSCRSLRGEAWANTFVH